LFGSALFGSALFGSALVTVGLLLLIELVTATQTNFLFFLSHIKVLPETFLMSPGLVHALPNLTAANACELFESIEINASDRKVAKNFIERL
jgi:hypothetical protein